MKERRAYALVATTTLLASCVISSDPETAAEVRGPNGGTPQTVVYAPTACGGQFDTVTVGVTLRSGTNTLLDVSGLLPRL